MKTEKFELKTRISEEILADLAKKMADKKVEFNEKKQTLSNFRTRLNKEIIALDEEITELADQVHSKHHTEKLDCPLNPLPASKRMELLHPNTGEVVHTRPMTADEAKEGYLFEGINDPETSTENAKAFLKKNKRDEGGEDDPAEKAGAFNEDDGQDEEFPAPYATPDNAIGEIEAGGEQFHKKAITETKINFPADLDFGAALRVAKDDGDCYHYGYRIASTKPKAAYALPVYVESVSYTDYPAMLESAAKAMIHRLTSDKKFMAMSNERTKAIVEVIEAFFEPEAAEAVAAD